MKRIVTFILFSTIVLTGCSKYGVGFANRFKMESADSSQDEKAAEDSKEIYEVVMQYPILESVPADLQKVEDALNLRTEKEIGVHVKFYPASSSELNSVTNLMISSGEKLDLMISMFEGGVSSYVNKGILLELDGLVEQYGADIIAAEGRAMSGGYFNGKLYAVPTEEKMGRVGAFLARRDILEKNAVEYDPDRIYSLKEISEIFAKVKTGEGENFYCIGINSHEWPPFYYTDPVDFLGAGLASGCLPDYGAGTATIVNYYETERFAEACKYARDWYQKGYYSPDCNTTTDASITLLYSGNYLGIFSNAEPDMIANRNAATLRSLKTDLVPFYINVPSSMTQHYQLTLWAIPVTCENPEKTMQWLNMMYADKEIINLLYRGIEGVHWNFVEGSDTVIERIGETGRGDSIVFPYASVLNVWGDKSKDYVTAPLDETYYRKLKDFNESIEESNISNALGYCFNNGPVKTEYAAVSDVINQYQMSLAMGVVNPDNMIPEFRKALKDAGIDNVIAENQKQFDAWLGRV